MLFLSFQALANGLTTHCWISSQAITLLPDGDLKILVSDPGLERYWRNGTMFPDGGYPQGDAYGEMAHWEPFQMAYLDWIRTNYQPPWSDEASQHIAFLLGMTSHGMADQSFDSMYMSRAWVYDVDSDWNQSMDTATDVVFSSLTGPQPVPDAWIPETPFVSLFELQGHLVDEDTLEDGQALVRTAVTWVGSAGQTEELVDIYLPQYPWANNNLLSETISGAPPVEAQLVAEYWQVVWDRLHESNDLQLLRAFPSADDYAHPIDSESIESRVTLVFAKGLQADLIDENQFVMSNQSGDYHPFAIDVFYGLNSHVVHLLPLEDFDLDTDYTITINAGLPFIDGTDLITDTSIAFTTKKAPRESSHNDDSPSKRGCQAIPDMESPILVVLFAFCFRIRRVLESVEMP